MLVRTNAQALDMLLGDIFDDYNDAPSIAEFGHYGPDGAFQLDNPILNSRSL